MRVNDGSGPFWGKGAEGPLPKYWHFASTTCRQCLQLAGRVYLWCTVSTDPRPPSPSMRVNDGSGPFWGKGAEGPLPKYWHFASTTCRQCLQLAGRVYLWCTVSTDPRPPSPSMRVNDGSGPFWGKGAEGPLPKYWHFASTTCRQCLQLAGRVYLWCTVSTDPRPPSPSMRVNDGSGPFWGKGAEGPPSQILALRVYNMPTVSTISRPRLLVVHSVYRPQTALPLYAGKRWQRTVLGEGGRRPPSQILALRVYNMPTVSTISRPRLLVVHSVYRPQTALPLYAGKRWQRTVLGEGGRRPPSQILALRVYNMPTVSTISRPRLLVVHSVYRPQTALPLYAGKRWQRTVLGEGGRRPPSQILALRVYNMPTVSTISRPRLLVVHSVYRPQTALPLYAGKRWQRTVLGEGGRRPPSQILAHIYTYICRTTLYDTVRRCVVLCRTVSYCVVQCRTVSYCVVPASYDTVRRVVQCRTVSYSVVQCRTSVVRHSTTRRTVSYKVSGPDASGMYDASYSVVQGVGARRVGDVRRVGRCRGPTRRKIPTSTVVQDRGFGGPSGEDRHRIVR